MAFPKRGSTQDWCAATNHDVHDYFLDESISCLEPKDIQLAVTEEVKKPGESLFDHKHTTYNVVKLVLCI